MERHIEKKYTYILKPSDLLEIIEIHLHADLEKTDIVGCIYIGVGSRCAPISLLREEDLVKISYTVKEEE